MITQTKNQTILVVEDEVSLLNALHDKLALEGFSVIEAKDGEDGLVAALREHPDLILLDIIMPKMDGIMMLKKLREDKWGKTARLIILTNLGDNEKVAEAMENETFDYIIKVDVKLEDVIRKIKDRLLEEKIRSAL